MSNKVDGTSSTFDTFNEHLSTSSLISSTLDISPHIDSPIVDNYSPPIDVDDSPLLDLASLYISPSSSSTPPPSSSPLSLSYNSPPPLPSSFVLSSQSIPSKSPYNLRSSNRRFKLPPAINKRSRSNTNHIKNIRPASTCDNIHTCYDSNNNFVLSSSVD